jgi:hypothetical protein
MKHIVTSGCSFTDASNCCDYTTHKMIPEDYDEDKYKSWALHLEDIIPDSKVYNRALPGAGNAFIVRSIIWQVNELLKQNIKPYVFMQLTSPDRKEFLLDCDDVKSETDNNLLVHYIPDIMPLHFDPHNAKELNDNKMWLKHTYEENSIMRYHYKYYNNKLSALVETFESVLRLQWFLKLHDIDYKIFPGWAVLQQWISTRGDYPLDFEFENIAETKHLWNMIDFDNIWFYKFKYSQVRRFGGSFGGITEWSEDNLPFKDRFITGDRITEDGFPLDQHPSNTAHKTFAKEVVSKWIK